MSNVYSEHPVAPTADGKRGILLQAEKAKKHFALNDPKTTMGQLADTISTFYGDYQNAPSVGDALLLSSEALDGRSPTADELDIARKRGALDDCF